MKSLIPIFLGIVTILLISGCTTGGIINPLCEEDYVKAYSVPLNISGESDCKSVCYSNYKVTSFKIEKEGSGLFTFTYCYCDINNCNPRKDIK